MKTRALMTALAMLAASCGKAAAPDAGAAVAKTPSIERQPDEPRVVDDPSMREPAHDDTTAKTATEAPAAERAAPQDPKSAELESAIAGAVGWLIANQNPDGSWGSHESSRPDEVLASIPGSQEAFRVATTALCVIALSDSGDRSPPAIGAAEHALDWLLANYEVKRQSGLEHYNVWSFGYALQCFGERLVARPEDARASKLRAACARILEKLGIYQTLDGGWGYLSMNAVPTFQPSDTSMSFTTATILVGMQRAKEAGIPLPAKMTARAVDHVERSRLPDGAFLYGEYLKYRPRMGINQRKGSACRNPLCLFALDLSGQKIDDASYRSSLEDLLIRYAGFQRSGVRRPIPHESWYQVSGYFYLYGHAYAAYVLEKLPKEDQKKFRPALVDAVMFCHQPDGSFWDYPLYSYHKPYGTAFAIVALSRCRSREHE